MAAWCLARYRFPGNRLLFFVIFSTIILPPQVTLIPTYAFYVRVLGWGGTWLPLIVPHEEWSGIEAAVVQRATLLNRILCDVYGRQDMLREGLLVLTLPGTSHGSIRARQPIVSGTAARVPLEGGNNGGPLYATLFDVPKSMPQVIFRMS